MSKVVAEQLRMEIAKLESEITALVGQKDGLLRALALVEGEPVAAVPPATAISGDTRKAKAPIKDTVLTLLMEHAASGLNAATLVSVAGARGISLDRASVSSLLSRLKKDGVLTYDGDVYKPATGGSGDFVAPSLRSII
ncbi:MAG TPA: hypothetical protein VGN96_15970 [Roseococcus sp.]|nr:hypothetical protein [Roseococcus sp.]